VVASYTSGNPYVPDAHEFNIQVNFLGDWTAAQQAVVEWAADFWSNVITKDVRDDEFPVGNPVDDIAITMVTTPIDGSGNTLALTGVTSVRDAGTEDQLLPVTAITFLDSDDLADPTLAGTWDTIILHEMAHALGFAGPLFQALGLTDASGNFFTGANAIRAYGGAVPLEIAGGTATAGSHWSETDFAPRGRALPNELMTGFIAPGENTYLSDTTVAALADMGYHVHDPSPGRSALLVDSGMVV
jgi:hypothetical protein